MKQIGIVGLGVMGENLAQNLLEKGFPIAVYNRTPDKVHEFVEQLRGKDVLGATSPQELAAALERPRRILLMVKAGKPVDDTIAALRPYLEPGDILVDGGNEYFTHTERRASALGEARIRYLGMGVSGGEEGARQGPSLMPGGDPSAWEVLAPVLRRIAAQVDDGPCVDYMGPGGAGHYVKMVHNGIEYGDMQLIAESYDLLKNLAGLDNEELAATFARWNEGELQSFLIEITAQIFTRRDDLGGDGYLIDRVLDAAGMKGTGKWTVQQAAELASPIPTIASALEARVLSARKAERAAAARILAGPAPVPAADRQGFVDDVRQALYAAKVCSYAQGMDLLRAASAAYGFGLRLGRIARIWKGGCIIRARLLTRIQSAYAANPEVANLLVTKEFAHDVAERQAAWRRVVGRAVAAGVPVPALASSLGYFDSYRRERLPTNLIQAQRDLFGAHTFERVDRPGSFHSSWK